MYQVKDYVSKEDTGWVEIREINTHSCYNFYGALLFKGKANELYEKSLNRYVIKVIWYDKNRTTLITLPSEIVKSIQNDNCKHCVYTEEIDEIARDLAEIATYEDGNI